MKLNKTLVIGNIANDPELKKVGNDLSVVNVRLLHNRSRKNKETNEFEDLEPVSFNLELFAKSADIFAEKVAKGDQVYIEGELVPNNYEKGDKKVYGYSLKVSDWQLLRKPNAK